MIHSSYFDNRDKFSINIYEYYMDYIQDAEAKFKIL